MRSFIRGLIGGTIAFLICSKVKEKNSNNVTHEEVEENTGE